MTTSLLKPKRIRNIERKCPYCNYITRTVVQLDHYLPKATFPVFSITVNNLVPICRDCNNEKSEYYSINESKTLLHPYYDDVLEDVFMFLKCRIIEDMNIGFEFYIEKLVGWDDVIFKRVNLHFKKLKIDDLYRTDFEADFVSCFEELKILYEQNGNLEEIRIVLDRKVKALYKTKVKPWAYVGFKRIMDSEWFFQTYLPSKSM